MYKYQRLLLALSALSLLLPALLYSQVDTAWVRRYNGPGNGSDYAGSLAVDGSGNVYVTGASGPINMPDYATIKYVQTQPGVEENEIATPSARNDFTVYPNPAKTFFNIRSSLFALHFTLKLYDVSGKMVKEIGDCFQQPHNDNIVRVSLDGIKNGVYFVKVGNELIKEKLVVTK